MIHGHIPGRFGSVYLVADVLGAVRVSSAAAAASLPQLRHVSVVSPLPGTLLCHISRVRGKEGGKEKRVQVRVVLFKGKVLVLVSGLGP